MDTLHIEEQCKKLELLIASILDTTKVEKHDEIKTKFKELIRAIKS